MEPRIIYKPAFSVVGISQPFTAWDGQVDALWAQLEQRYLEISIADPDIGFGVHTWKDGKDRYLAGLALRKVPGRGGMGPLPQGMTRLSFDPHAYAVFTHNGVMAGMTETISTIYEGWLPGSSYRSAADFYFEYFDDRFQPGSRDSVLFIFVPVTKRLSMQDPSQAGAVVDELAG